MILQINGQSREISAPTLKDLLTELKIQSDYLAVAVNDQVIPGSDYESTTLKNQDSIEIIQPVSGG